MTAPAKPAASAKRSSARRLTQKISTTFVDATP
ncbi:hypothetical protein SAMN06265338_1573 [Rhodoblastus acidophilus]|uniref:Uncharacterized protein n=1 Tax=Rhodoblastus acidophilus TaxID=1074 RepID=A0A212SIQ5_RHOAC|nr:hypothetical protein SAMN06265338_1573 [Rhodoblastus acidophilus]